METGTKMTRNTKVPFKHPPKVFDSIPQLCLPMLTLIDPSCGEPMNLMDLERKRHVHDMALLNHQGMVMYLDMMGSRVVPLKTEYTLRPKR